VLDVNLQGVVHGTAIAYAAMLQQGSGHIVNVSSGQGLVPFSLNVPYCAAKHAVVGLSLGLRAEALPLGVKVSVVCPGGVETEMFAHATFRAMSPERVRAWSSRYRLLPASTAARAILRGVARERAIIVFPTSMRIVWWFYRLVPWLWNALGPSLVQKTSRTLRDPDAPDRSAQMLAGPGNDHDDPSPPS
jgi:short-subunit dehydrogenase